MRQTYKIIFLFTCLLFVTAFLLHFLWEYLHYVLYICDVERLTCALVAALVDAFITLGIYYFFSGPYHDFVWFRRFSVRKIFLLLLVGFFIAYLIELRGLYFARWSYSALMPLIPVLQVGVSPIMQMMILPLVSLLISRFLLRVFEKIY